MKKKLFILILEDNPSDAELIERELRKEKILFFSKCVSTEKDFCRELRDFVPDIIISDYMLPQFDGMSALELVKEHAPSTPVIICTGSMNEDTAVECMKAGATDYVIKEHLVRIVPAVKSALEKKRISEEKNRAEEALRMSAKEWQITFNAIENGVALMSSNRKLVRCNKTMISVLGKPMKDILGRTCCELICNRSEYHEKCPFIRMRETQQRETFILKLNNKWFIEAIDPVFDDGNITGAVQTLSDITELKESETKLNEERNLLRTLIDNMPVFIYIKDRESKFNLANKAVSDLMGAKTPDELIGKTDYDYYPRKLASQYHTDEQEIIKKGNPINNKEEAAVDTSGNQRWTLTTKVPLQDNDGNIIGIIGIGRDITEHKQSEESMRIKDIAISSSINAIAIADLEGNLTYVNPSFLKLWRYENDKEVLGKPTIEFWEKKERAAEIVESLRARGSYIGELMAKRKDGSLFNIQISASMIADEAGRTICMMASFLDITERKEAEEALHKSEKSLKNAQRVAHLGNWDWNIQTNKLLWSDEIYRIFGLKPQEFGATYDAFLNFVHPDDREYLKKSVNEALNENKPYSIDHRCVQSDGTIRIVHEQAEVVYDDSGKPIQMLGIVQDITERKEAEDALKESEERFRLTIEATREGLWENSPDHKKDFFNDRFFTMLGYEPVDHAKGFDFFNRVMHPDDVEIFEKEYNSLNKPGLDDYSVEFRLKAKDGTWRHILSRGKCVKRDEKGKPIRIIGTHTDITERKEAEEALRASEERFALAVQGTNDGIWDWDIKNSTLYWSPRMKELHGYTGDEIEVDFDTFMSHLHPDSIEKTQKALEAHLKDRVPYDIEQRVLTKSGDHRWMYVRGSAVRDEAGTPIRMVGSSTDITDRKLAEKALQESQRQLTTLMSNLPGMAYSCKNDSKWTMEFVSNGCYSITGYKPEELVGNARLAYVELIHPEDLQMVWDVVQNALTNERPFQLVYRIINANEEKKWVWEQGQGIVDEDGNINVIEGFITDITDRKLAEEELRKLSVAVEQSPVCIIITNKEGNIEYVNFKFTELTGYTYKEVIGKNPRLLKSGEHPHEFYKQLWDTITSGKAWEGEFHNKKKNGELYWEDATISPIKNEEGKITHYLAIKEDITARKNLQNQLQQAQKMEAIGRFAGGIAHDFNNMMTAVIGFSDYLISQFKEDHTTRSIVEQIKNAGSRAASLTSQLLTFSRKQATQIRLIDLNSIIADIKQILQRLLEEDIELKTSFNTRYALTKADQSQIEQIIMNLAVNARDAMPEGGKLIIETSKVELDEEQCKQWIDIQPGKYVKLSVSDNGYGMDKETQEHIFEPFFTTKEVGEGTGLGLSTVYGIVKQVKGYIHVYSEPGEGTTFNIYFPSTIEDKADTADKEEVSKDTLKGTETVLVVEDEELVRKIVTKTLIDNGYKVLEASNGKKALTLYNNYKGEIHLLVTDVIIPGLKGSALAKELISMSPEIKLLFISGYTNGAAEQLELLDHESRFLEKPFTPNKLLSIVREILEENKAPKS